MTLIQIHREKACLTLAELAKKTGIRFSTLWKMEHEQRKVQVNEIALLARALGCKPSALIPEIPDAAPVGVKGE